MELFKTILSIIYSGLTFLAVIAALVGLPYMFVQNRKTKNIAETAKDTAEKTGKQLQKNEVVVILSRLEKSGGQIRSNIRDNRIYLADYLVTEVKLMFVELKNFPQFSKKEERAIIMSYIAELTLINEKLSNKMEDNEFEIKLKSITKTLLKIEEFMRERASIEKYKLEGGS